MLLAQAEWRLGIAPPSDVIRPPSKAALTFLRATAGRSKGRGISSAIRVYRSSITLRLPLRPRESCCIFTFRTTSG